MRNLLIIVHLLFCAVLMIGCDESKTDNNIEGFNLLSEITGHWVGTNQTSFGFYDWFAFDFRPISASHTHSIYEGGTNTNIITSLFIADFEGEQKIMVRNGGWLGTQYRATYFVLDMAQETTDSKYYRLVDAIGGIDRAYMEFRFENDTMYFDAYKDNSGSLDQAIHHMGFKGTNYNPNFSVDAINQFNFPQTVSEVDFTNAFTNLIDPDSALFLEESDDPFPKSEHGHLSDLTININRNANAIDKQLLLYVSKEPIITNGVVDFENLDKQIVRTIDLQANEDVYISTYLHPDEYYFTLFSDEDQNFFPSANDVYGSSSLITVAPETFGTTTVNVGLLVN